MDVNHWVALVLAAGVMTGAVQSIVVYARNRRRHDMRVGVQVGDVRVTIEGPLSKEQANRIVAAVAASGALDGGDVTRSNSVRAGA